MTLSELNRPFSLTPQLVVKVPWEAPSPAAGAWTLGWMVLMSTKSAATGPFPPWPPSGCSSGTLSSQPASASSPSGRSPAALPIATAIRSMLAPRFSSSGFIIEPSVKPVSCRCSGVADRSCL